MNYKFSPYVFFAGIFCLAMLFGGTLMAALGITPFGTNSLAIMDARIQYLDFFAYYKEILSGNSSPLYSFSKMLGGNSIADYSYYLSSPLNLLIIFFDKADLNNFFSLIVLIKQALAATFFAIYIKCRWNNVSTTFTVALSLSYAFSQYTISQACNIMWLDGVFMLPIIMIGVCKLIHKGRIELLIIGIGLNIIFSWYTAYFNILFSFVYLIFELLYQHSSIKNSSNSILKAILASILGTGCGMFILLPTLTALSTGKGGIEWSLLHVGLNGDPLTILSNYIIGGISERGNAAIYCGSIIIPLAISFLFFTKTNNCKKIAVWYLLIITILSLYFIPLEFIFNEMRRVSSYYYRYSYLSSCAIIIVALCFLSENVKETSLIKSSLIFSSVIVLLNFIKPQQPLDNLYTTAILAIVLSALFIIITTPYRYKYIKKIAISSFIVILMLDLGLNYIAINKHFGFYSTREYKTYILQQEQVINKIKSTDKGIYRIVNQQRRANFHNKNNPNNNEPVAFNYMGISSYSSSFSTKQKILLHWLGYSTFSSFSNIDSRIVSSDSLLSVKYIINEDPTGDSPLALSSKENKVYENPNFIPFGFIYHGNIDKNTHINKSNPFIFQNELFSILSGNKVTLFKPLTSSNIIANKKNITYQIKNNGTEGQIYGYIQTHHGRDIGGEIYNNNKFITQYSGYLAPFVFHAGKSIHGEDLLVNYKNIEDVNKIKNSTFAVLDTNELSRVTKKISSGGVENLKITNKSISVSVTAPSTGYSLFLPIVADKGWKIYLNDKEISINNNLNDIVSIPLNRGENKVFMEFTPPGILLGFIISAISGLIVIILKLSPRLFRGKR